MSYRLFFKTAARKEWDKLDTSIRTVFKKRLAERLKNPRREPSRLSGMKDCYKIKLRQAGYRLVYQVRDTEIVVVVVAVGKREKNFVYKKAIKRI
jgi:mRNA interferase RelE/StbE